MVELETLKRLAATAISVKDLSIPTSGTKQLLESMGVEPDGIARMESIARGLAAVLATTDEAMMAMARALQEPLEELGRRVHEAAQQLAYAANCSIDKRRLSIIATRESWSGISERQDAIHRTKLATNTHNATKTARRHKARDLLR